MLKLYRDKDIFVYIMLMVLIGSTIISASMLSSSIALADDVIDEINVSVPISCTASSSGGTSHRATISNGTYTPNIGTTTFNISCNDNGGFAIYASGYTGNEAGGTNSNKLLGTSTGLSIVTGTATAASDPDVSNWAMKLDTNANATYPITIDGDNSGSFSAYHAVPNDYIKVAHRNSGTDVGNNAVGSAFTTTYGVYISKAQTADAYAGKVRYMLVHPSDVPLVYCNSNATTIAQAKCMQDFAHVSSANRESIIASMVPETQYTLKDQRDGKSYTVAKLRSGTDEQSGDPIYDVWMTKNLDLDLDSSKTYTNLDTDIGYDASMGVYSAASWSPGYSTFQEGESDWDNINWEPAHQSFNPGDLYWNGEIVNYDDYNNSCHWNDDVYECDESLRPSAVSTSGIPQYHLGNYYNWPAATAMEIVDDYWVNYPLQDEIVDRSICPAGWTLPRPGKGRNSVQAMWEEYGWVSAGSNRGSFSNIADLIGSPIYLVPNGEYGGGGASYIDLIGDSGYYWLPMLNIAEDGLYSRIVAELNSVDYVSPNGWGESYEGSAIRCIARPVTNEYVDQW